MLLYGIAFLAGVVTAISPCAYPVLPIVFAGGASGGERRPFAIVAGLVTTFLVSLLALTWIIDRLGLPKDLLRNISIGLLFLAAATLIVPQLGRALERPLARLSRRRGGDLGGGFLLGAALGLVFAPCAGVVLTAVVGETASSSGLRRFAVALVYALGAGLTLLGIAILARRSLPRLRAFDVNRLRIALGVVIGLATLGIAFNLDTKLQTHFPDYTSALQSAVGEKSCYARKHLGQRCLASRHVASGPKAPNFTGISDWINSKPLTTQKLHGKVVLVDFWTYSCINCLRTLPHLKAWYAAYHKEGLEIVGVHTPEFAFEHVPSNVRGAVRRPRRPLPRRDRQLRGDLEGVPELRLADGVPDRPRRPDPRGQRGRGPLRRHRAEDPRAARRVDEHARRLGAGQDAEPLPHDPRVVPRLAAARPLRRRPPRPEQVRRSTTSPARCRPTALPTRAAGRSARSGSSRARARSCACCSRRRTSTSSSAATGGWTSSSTATTRRRSGSAASAASTRC